MVGVASPAPAFCARELLGTLAGAKPFAGRLAAYQLALAETHGLMVAGELLVLIGFYPVARRELEAFFVAADPARVVPHAVGLYRAGRLIVRRRWQDDGVDRIVAHTSRVRVSSRGEDFGGRLARSIGFVPTIEPPGAFLQWELRRAERRDEVRSEHAGMAAAAECNR